MLVACVAAASGLTACDQRVTSDVEVSVVPETRTTVDSAYVVESSELIEISRFDDGSVKYAPTGWIVDLPSTRATATAAALRQ
jgi:hypothetical protein